MSVAEKRAEMRRTIRDVAQANAGRPRITHLGMHYMPAQDGTPILVTVELNVQRLLAIIGKRLRKSKRGAASMGRGSVRVEIATPNDRELVAALNVSTDAEQA